MKRLAWVDLSDFQHRFVTGPGAAASPRERGRVNLEYRRFLLLRLAYRELNIPAPSLIDSYWRLHAADQPRFAAVGSWRPSVRRWVAAPQGVDRHGPEALA
ncbi:MAG: hypothetical protein ACRDRX_18745 [Pseudonocardiaceae bacterium]